MQDGVNKTNITENQDRVPQYKTMAKVCAKAPRAAIYCKLFFQVEKTKARIIIVRNSFWEIFECLS